MAERRMFAKTIIDSDAFLEMPISARLLYYDLSMRADDDGFNNSPKKIMRTIGATQDDLNILVARKFIIPFENGVIVIKHWRIHNYIRKDTYNETSYKEQKAMLELDENNAYRIAEEADFFIPSTTRRRPVDDPSTQVRLGKDSLGKVSRTSASSDSVAIALPLNDGTAYAVCLQDIDTWSKLYPAVDVMSELRKMAGWLDGNPKKRKTKQGVRRFITGWLSREQDKGSDHGEQLPQRNFLN